jgi:hypothetical protein
MACPVAAMMLVAGCGGGGSSGDTAITNTTVSKGQELLDLKRALDTGAISKGDYDRQRSRILSE